jgi:Xaa-Pro dipeptidase
VPQVFSKREISQRLNRVQRLMREQKLDVLMISNEENFQYFSGVSGTICLHNSNTRPAVLFVPVSGEPIAVVGSASAPTVAEAVKDTRVYTSTSGVPTQLYVKAIKDAGLERRRVGVERGHETRLGMPLGEIEAVMGSLSAVSFVDVSSLIWSLRMIKSEEELSLMRLAAVITGKARQATFDQVSQGVSLRDVARIFGKEMLANGADRVNFVHIGTKLPMNLTQFHSETKLRKGDLLFLDGGAYVRSHTTNYSRLATIGKASAVQIKYHRLIQGVARTMLKETRAGVRCDHLWRVARDAIRDSGFSILDVGRLGHGLGMHPTEPPSVSETDTTVLKPGMVMSVEPFATWGSLPTIWQDIYVIGRDENELLTHETHELRQLG